MNRIVHGVIVIGILWSTTIFGAKLTDAALFNRCYIQLTGHPLPLNDPRIQKIKGGQLKAVDACNSLLESAILNDNTGNLIQTENSEGLWILNTLYSFHRSWFPTISVEQIQGYGEETSGATRDIYDSTEPSLALTRAVFAQSAKYSDVVTLNTGVLALRRDNPAIKNWAGLTYPSRIVGGPLFENNRLNFREFNDGDPTHGYDINADTTRSTFLLVPKIQTGELIGIAPQTRSFTIPNVSLNTLAQLPDVRGSDVPGFNFRFDLYKTYGGGVLGSPIFAMLNWGHPLGMSMNGQTKVPRRWAKTIMNTFMCAPLPTLRPEDVSQFMVTTSTAPFRKSTSCLMCHGTIDQMAYTARNLVLVNSDVYPTVLGTSDNRFTRTALMMTGFNPTMTATARWADEPVNNFQRQNSLGTLYTRLFSGQLLNKPVKNIAELGTAIAETEDFYQCAAKRYFEFLTGNKVLLFDRTNPANDSLNKQLVGEALENLKFVQNLAEDLKKTQSVREMIKSIFSSRQYGNADFRPF